MFLAVYLCATTASESDYVLVVLHQTPAGVPPDSSKSASGAGCSTLPFSNHLSEHHLFPLVSVVESAQV